MIDPEAKRSFDHYWDRIHLESQYFMADNFIEQIRRNIQLVDCQPESCDRDRDVKEFFQYVIDKFTPLLTPEPTEPEPILT